MNRTLLRLLAPLLALGLLLAACSDDDGEGGNTDPAAEEPGAVDQSTVPEVPGADQDATTDTAAGATVVAATETDVGSTLVDADGFALYAYADDTADTSECTEGCATGWPPLLTDGDPEAGDGVDATKLGTLTHDDGSTQVSYDGHPLYRYSGDTEAGQVTGVGIPEWSPMGPDGPIATDDGAGGGE